MKRNRIKLIGKFRDVRIFYDGMNQEHSERSKGNEIKSVIIETDTDFDVSESEEAGA